MALQIHRWTRADLERLPEDSNKYEVIDGELLVSPAPGPTHEYVLRHLRLTLEAFCHREGIAHVFDGKPAFVTEDSETMPDLIVQRPAFPPPERWDDMPTPTLVVEVISESTRRNDEGRKRRFYIRSGISEYWMFDRKSRSVRVVTESDDRQESVTLRWHPLGASAPLEIDLRRFFEDALGPAEQPEDH